MGERPQGKTVSQAVFVAAIIVLIAAIGVVFLVTDYYNHNSNSPDYAVLQSQYRALQSQLDALQNQYNALQSNYTTFLHPQTPVTPDH